MVKVCVASRPWVAFENVFGGNPQRMLLVEDFTRDDMARFVKITLEESPQLASILKQDRRAMALIHEIREMAQGVFLWVTLVVKSLLSGATQQDDLEELTIRLRALPRDLKGFFQRMLDCVDDNYETHAARILLLAQSATPLPLMAFSWTRLEVKRPDYALEGKIEDRDNDDRRKHQARVFLNKLSKDLLIVYDSSSSAVGSEDMADLKIDFLDRTVGEFLREPDVHSMLLARAGHEFDPHQSFCRLLLAETKTVRMSDDSKNNLDMFQGLARRLMFHAKQYEEQHQSGLTEILLSLDKVISLRLAHICPSHWTASIDVVHPGPIDSHRQLLSHSSSNFFAYAVANDLIEFVRETLSSSPGQLKKTGRPLLDYALYPTFSRYDQPPQWAENVYPKQMIELLLDG